MTSGGSGSSNQLGSSVLPAQWRDTIEDDADQFRLPPDPGLGEDRAQMRARAVLRRMFSASAASSSDNPFASSIASAVSAGVRLNNCLPLPCSPATCPRHRGCTYPVTAAAPSSAHSLGRHRLDDDAEVDLSRRARHRHRRRHGHGVARVAGEGAADQLLQLAVVARVGRPSRPPTSFLPSLAASSSRNKVLFQHLAGLIEHERAHRQTADRLRIQRAKRLAAIDQIVDVQRTTKMLQQRLAARPIQR